MTQLLDKAFQEASKLSDPEQNALARWLIEEIISEKKWEKAFSASEDMLESLAEDALEEHAEGRTEQMDIDGL